MLPLISTLQAASQAGCLHVERLPALTPQLNSMLSEWQKIAGEFEIEVLYLALTIWSRVHGLVMVEITHHMPPFFDVPAEVFVREIQNMLVQYL